MWICLHRKKLFFHFKIQEKCETRDSNFFNANKLWQGKVFVLKKINYKLLQRIELGSNIFGCYHFYHLLNGNKINIIYSFENFYKTMLICVKFVNKYNTIIHQLRLMPYITGVPFKYNKTYLG